MKKSEPSYTVIFERESSGYTVLVPALPGLVTHGKTLSKARAMALDAIRCHLESLQKDGLPIPRERGVDVEKIKVHLAHA